MQNKDSNKINPTSFRVAKIDYCVSVKVLLSTTLIFAWTYTGGLLAQPTQLEEQQEIFGEVTEMSELEEQADSYKQKEDVEFDLRLLDYAPIQTLSEDSELTFSVDI